METSQMRHLATAGVVRCSVDETADSWRSFRKLGSRCEFTMRNLPGGRFHRQTCGVRPVTICFTTANVARFSSTVPFARPLCAVNPHSAPFAAHLQPAHHHP